MGKRKSKGRPPRKKGKSKNNRIKTCEPDLSRQKQNVGKQEYEKQKAQKTSYEEIAQIFLGTDAQNGLNLDNFFDENIAQTSETGGEDNVEGAASTNGSTPNNNTNASSNGDINIIKAKQQEILSNLKNLNDAIAAITLTRDNISSLRVEVLSNIYFTREIRPLIDAVNLIAFASSNMTNAANNITNNVFGDKKEIKEAFKLSYKMNDEISDMICALSRRIKLYVAELNNMDKNCPPFACEEDSQK